MTLRQQSKKQFKIQLPEKTLLIIFKKSVMTLLSELHKLMYCKHNTHFAYFLFNVSKKKHLKIRLRFKRKFLRDSQSEFYRKGTRLKGHTIQLLKYQWRQKRSQVLPNPFSVKLPISVFIWIQGFAALTVSTLAKLGLVPVFSLDDACYECSVV